VQTHYVKLLNFHLQAHFVANVLINEGRHSEPLYCALLVKALLLHQRKRYQIFKVLVYLQFRYLF